MVLPGTIEVDHRNGNTLDNRRGNLRPATRYTQAANTLKKRTVAPYKGLSPTIRGTWTASIRADGRRKNLGHFKNPVEAAKAYDAAARAIHGEFACVNFPIGDERGAS